MEQSVPKRRHVKFRHRGITQKKTYDIVTLLPVKEPQISGCPAPTLVIILTDPWKF